MSDSIKSLDSTSVISCDFTNYIFSLQTIVSSVCEYEITIGLSLKDTDGHGFGNILGFPLMLKESSKSLLNFLSLGC